MGAQTTIVAAPFSGRSGREFSRFVRDLSRPDRSVLPRLGAPREHSVPTLPCRGPQALEYCTDSSCIVAIFASRAKPLGAALRGLEYPLWAPARIGVVASSTGRAFDCDRPMPGGGADSTGC